MYLHQYDESSKCDCSMYFFREISLIQLTDGVTYTLHEFVHQQDKAMLLAKQELTILRKEIIAVIVSSCQVSVNNLSYFEHSLCKQIVCFLKHLMCSQENVVCIGYVRTY